MKGKHKFNIAFILVLSLLSIISLSQLNDQLTIEERISAANLSTINETTTITTTTNLGSSTTTVTTSSEQTTIITTATTSSIETPTTTTETTIKSKFKIKLLNKEGNSIGQIRKIKPEGIQSLATNTNSIEEFEEGKHDLELETPKAKVKLHGLVVNNDINIFIDDYIQPSTFTIATPVIATDAEISSAEITLIKYGNVNAVFRCNEFDTKTFTCDSWSATDIPFSDNGTHITLVADHFSGYAAGYTSNWWNSSWQYRKPITIANTAGNLSNYQINVTVNTTQLISQGKMKSDCGDVRFTWYNSSSGTEINISYWNETACNTSSTNYWINVPFSANNTNTTVYMYYGNANAQGLTDWTPSNITYSYTSAETVNWTVPNGITTVAVLVVAGGGGGGGFTGGGGGAGGLLYNGSYAVTTSANITVTIGIGGTGGTGQVSGTKGGNSTFDAMTSIGGGGGGQYASQTGGSGGSGGGGGASFGTSEPGSGTVGPPRQGYDGGHGPTGTKYPAGGGGGAGAVGSDGVPNTGGGNGGVGVDYSTIFGTSVGESGWFSGGGGGGSYTGTDGTGGNGGGGDAPFGNALANTGGGGAGSHDNSATQAGAGGSGIVLIKCINSTNVSITIGSEESYTGTFANLTIFDDTDPEGGNQKKKPADQVNFFANYTNSTGNAINGTGIWCNVTFNISDGWTSPIGMTFNATYNLYTYNRSFSTITESGNYNWNVTCNGSALGYAALSINDTFTLDATPPSILIQLPQNTTYLYNTSLPLNYTVSDNMGVDSCWYNLDNGDNTTLNNCANATFNTSEGSHTLYLFANDTAGNLNNTLTVGFTIRFSINYTSNLFDIIEINQNLTSTKFELIANVTINLNSTVVNPSAPMSIWGLAYMNNGTNVTNNSIAIWLDGTLLNVTNPSGYVCALGGNWQYRKIINISNTADNLTDYQINISVNATPLYEAGKLMIDCNDTRFTWLNSSSGQEQLIPHWTENCTTNNNGTLSKFWIKVPFLQNNTNTTVYMYYGNNNASSTSNGTATFIFFDDFDSGLGKWTNFGSPTPITFTDSSFHDTYGYSSNGDGSYPSGSYASSTYQINVSKGITIETRQKQPIYDSDERWNFLGVFLGNTQTGYTETSGTNIHFGYITRGTNVHASGYGNDYQYHSSSYDGNSGGASEANDQQYHRFTMKYNGSTGVTYYRDGILEYTSSTIYNSPRSYDVLPIVLGGRAYNYGNGAIYNYLDFVAAREYASQEPSYTVSSEEQTQTQTSTDSSGLYNYTFTAPSTIGIHNITVNFTDSFSNEFGTNSTTFSVYASYTGNVTEPISISDLTGRAISNLRAMTQAITQSELVNSLRALIRNVIQSVTLYEDISKVRSISKTVLETIGINEEFVKDYSAQRTSQEPIAISESPSKQSSLQRLLSEYFSLGDYVNFQRAMARVLLETLGIEEDIAKTYAAQRTEQQAIIISEQPGRQSSLQRLLSDYFSILENATFSTIKQYSKTILDTIGLNEDLVKSYEAERTAQQSVTISGQPDRRSIMQRLLSEYFLINENIFASKIKLYSRAILDTIGIYEDLDKTYAAERKADQSLTLIDSLNRQLSFQRILAQYFSISENIISSTFKTYSRELFQTIGINESIAKSYSITRTTEQAISINEIAGRLLSLGRGLSDYLTMQESTTRIRGFSRTVIDQIQLAEGIKRYISILRDLFDTIGIGDQGAPTTTTTTPTTTSPPSGGGGGGFGGVTTTTIPGTIEIPIDTIDIVLKPNEYQIILIPIINNKNEEVTANISIEGHIKEFVQLETKEVKIKPFSTGYANIKFLIPATADKGLYAGNIVIIIEKTIHKISSYLKIITEAEKEKLLDLKIRALNKLVLPGDAVKIDSEIYNLGEAEKFDIALEVSVKSVLTDELITSVTESIAIETSLYKIIAIKLPDDIKPGKYKVNAVAYYDNKTAIASETFDVTESEIEIFIANYWIYILLILILAILLAFIVIRVKKATEIKEIKSITQQIKDEHQQRVSKLSNISEYLETGQHEKQNAFSSQEPHKIENSHLKSARLTYLKNYFNKKVKKNDSTCN